jgi:3-deoxy-D-manno-octulosonic-acid transferase
MGELAGVYALATLVFVGGSLIPHGGQNTIEPSALARPVLFGPHTANFRDVNEELLAHDAARRVADAAELEAALRDLLARPEAAAELGRRARQVVDQHRGATRRTVEALEPFLQP